ncbi:tellurium resistance protein [Rhodovulum sp. ES.010]|uniref:SLAC1 family transporter n=1 Tax=Rhodovulum sp. ES.010 TaxID=1882821 RepID=UPI0011154435|nr:tellurium resistance protein [Rhodovulum sp. ES.010]
MAKTPPPLFAPRPRFGAATPPAIFGPVFGALGLGLAWRAAAEVFAVPPAIGDLVLGAVTLLFLFCVVAYGVKAARRPGVVAEDLRILPGRAGLSAGALSIYLVAASLVPLAPGLAALLLWAGLAMHAVLAALVVRVFASAPAEQRAVTPVWHLQFVGFIVAALAAAPLGFAGLASALLHGTAAMAVAIWTVSLVQMVRRRVPAPLRPLLAIHLAPACLLATVAALLGRPDVAAASGLLATLILAVLLVRLPWLLRAGFSPLWSAFTFPLAAYAGMGLVLAAAGQGAAFRLLGGLALVGATLAIPPILIAIMRSWAKGILGPKTNAVQA